MKQFFALLLCLAVIAGSCTKEYVNPTPTSSAGNNNNNNSGGGGSGGGGGGGGGPTIGPVPSTFGQKAVVEEFTGTWCGFCPDGALILEDLEAQNPGKVIGASVHQGDPMELPFFTTLDNTFGVPGFPTGMVNRVPLGTEVAIDRSQWGSAANMQLANTASCGLAMSSYIDNGNVNVTVHCGFNTTLSGDYRVTIMLTEDKVVGFPQANYYDDGSLDPNSPLVGLGDPIVDWEHNTVVRAILTADLGDAIPANEMVPGGEYVITKTAPVTGYTTTNLHIVALINLVGTDAMSHKVMNAQEAAVYEVKNWD